MVKIILRTEAVLVLLALLFVYWRMHASWVVFLVFLLAPDLLMVGYLKGTRIGAWCYIMVVQPWFATVAVIWAAHIAFDRALGYGLKYSDSFQHTHLGMIGGSKH